MRLLPVHMTLLALVAALALIAAGCGGSFAPTLPSPNGEQPSADTGTSTVTPAMGGVDSLPSTLTAGNFQVTLDGAPTRVISAIYGEAITNLAICLILDTTGSMGGQIAGVRDSILAFADAFSGKTVTWSGVEYGDGDFTDGPNQWDFFGRLKERTKFDPSTDVVALKAWIGTLQATGGGDAAENPLKAMMNAKNTFTWPVGAARHFIIITDVGAHERTDGDGDTSYGGPEIFCPYTGAEVLAAFRGWATVHCVSPDYSRYWAPAAIPSNAKLQPQVYTSAGWDVRELADGGPPAYRTHTGTGGKWAEMPDDGDVDLTKLGIAESINSSYTIVYERPSTMTSAHVVIKATYPGAVVTFDLGTVTF